MSIAIATFVLAGYILLVLINNGPISALVRFEIILTIALVIYIATGGLS